jgi:hypothetical protein
MCDNGHKLDQSDLADTIDPDINNNAADLTKLEKNHDLTDTWLLAPDEQQQLGAISLPPDGLRRLYAKEEGQGLKYFYEFVLFCVEASSQGTGSPSSGGQSEGRKTAAPVTISAPVGGFVTTP